MAFDKVCELPDADGNPVHVGDWVQSTRTGKVVQVERCNDPGDNEDADHRKHFRFWENGSLHSMGAHVARLVTGNRRGPGSGMSR